MLNLDTLLHSLENGCYIKNIHSLYKYKCYIEEYITDSCTHVTIFMGYPESTRLVGLILTVKGSGNRKVNCTSFDFRYSVTNQIEPEDWTYVCSDSVAEGYYR